MKGKWNWWTRAVEQQMSKWPKCGLVFVIFVLSIPFPPFPFPYAFFPVFNSPKIAHLPFPFHCNLCENKIFGKNTLCIFPHFIKFWIAKSREEPRTNLMKAKYDGGSGGWPEMRRLTKTTTRRKGQKRSGGIGWWTHSKEGGHKSCAKIDNKFRWNK